MRHNPYKLPLNLLIAAIIYIWVGLASAGVGMPYIHMLLPLAVLLLTLRLALI